MVGGWEGLVFCCGQAHAGGEGHAKRLLGLNEEKAMLISIWQGIFMSLGVMFSWPE